VTGKSLQPPNQQKWIWLGAIIVITLTLVVALILVIRARLTSTLPDKTGVGTEIPGNQTQPLIPPTTDIPEADVLPTQSPLLEEVNFPDQSVEYPAEWPKSLMFPNEFQLVETSMGKITQNSPTGYGAKLLFIGKPAQAADLLETFLKSKGWQIYQKDILDSGSAMILIQNPDNSNSGIIQIDLDSQNPDRSKILVTAFP